MYKKTYTATVVGPIFYSSIEGEVIKTDKFLSSTALSYALGYKLEQLDKHYVLTGDSSTKPDYSPIEDLPFFTSDLVPIDVSVDEHTYRSFDYVEYNITTGERDIAEDMNGDFKYSFPKIKNKSSPGWQEQQWLTGISVGSTYRFTVWSDIELPDELRFEMGINRTGYIVAESEDSSPDTTALNEYLLKEIYNLPKEDVGQLLANGASYYAANDPRISRYSNVDLEDATSLIEKHKLHKSQ